MRELKQTKNALSIMDSLKNLSKMEKANLRRALVEVSTFLVILTLLGLLNFDDKDKEDSYFLSLIEYQLKRMRREIGALIPGKTMLDEGLSILKSPTASIPTVQNSLNLINLIFPSSYTKILESGNYKDHTMAFKYFMESPLVPMRKTIMRNFDPELASR